MRLSTKTRYGVRAIFDIAYHGQDAPQFLVDRQFFAVGW